MKLLMDQKLEKKKYWGYFQTQFCILDVKLLLCVTLNSAGLKSVVCDSSS